MQQRQGTLLCIAIGLAFVLAASLISLLAPSQGTAYAQTTPSASVSIGEDTLPQGGATYLAVGLRNMPQDPNDDGEFHPDLVFRLDLHRNSDGSWVEENDCDSTLFGKNYHIDTWWRDDITFFRGTDNLNIARDCPTGSYRVTVTAKNNSTNTTIATDTRSLTVLEGPDVDIGFSAQPYYRGNEIDVTMEFSHLNNLQDRSGLSYRADIMKIISENSMNFADDCEGEALGNVDKSQDANHASSNLADTPSGSVDGNDPDGTVEKYGEVSSTCPTGNYKLTVELWDSDQNELMTATKLFAVTTDPNATPSARLDLSATTVTPGTEITYEASFFDLATYEGQSVDFREELTKDGANAPDSCKEGLFDIDVGTRLHGNPYVHSGTIPTTCPAGSYTLKAMLKNTDGNEILSASASFRIGTPDLKPSAPTVSAITTRQNDYFSQRLPEGSGGDGTLTYSATSLPAGLEFVTTTRTLRGTPTAHGNFTIIYTVTDSDGDSAHVNISFTVEQDHYPTFSPPPIPDYTGLEDSPFTQQLPAATGGNGALTYDATGLPAGLSFIPSTRTISGTPPTPGIGNVEYTATDTDGDVAGQSFIITITTDLQPVLAPQSNLTGRVGSPFAKFLPQATGGNGTLVYEATTPPPGLTFDDSLVKIKGTPTIADTTTVTLTVRDQDGDEHSLPFNIVIEPDNQPTLAAVSNMTGRVGSPFSESLPQGSGGDGDHDHDITTTLPDGLVFDEAMFKINGTPTTQAQRNTPVTYVVTDDDGDQASQSFTITIEQDGQPALDPVTSLNAKVGTLFTKVLDPATGGDSDLEYNAAPLPPGLTFIQSSRTITGTPTTQGTTTVEYTATDGDDTATDVDDDVARQYFDIVVYSKPTLRDVDNVMATKDAVFTLVLHAVDGGRGDFEYTASPLPDGLSFVESSRTITGTPTTVQDIDVTYKVTDADNDTASVEFKISVSEGDTSPTLQTVNDQYARKDSPFSFTLPRSAGGNAPYTYTATPLPTGLTFNESELKIEGTPTQVEDVSVTYTVTDTDLDVASQSFTIHVSDDLMPTLRSIQDFTGVQNSPFSEQLPAASGGDGTLEYNATGLPAGLSFVEATLTITGTPPTAGIGNVEYTATDTDGDVARQSFIITITTDLQPVLAPQSNLTGRVGSPFAKFLPQATGGNGTLVYEATTPPPGLTFDDSLVKIKGTPTIADTTTVTLTVRDQDGDEHSLPFNIVIEPDNQPTLAAVSNMTGRVGSPFSESLPQGSGGDGDHDHDITTTLPDGLVFDEAMFKINGTPTTQAQRNTPVTYVVTDDDGDQASQSFTITIEQDGQPALDPVTSLNAKVGTLFTKVLDPATGGDSDLEYNAAPLPPGLTFIQSSRTITGTPTTQGTTTVEYTATDGDDTATDVDDDVARQYFDIVVYSKPTLRDVDNVMATKDAVFTLVLHAVDGGRGDFEYTASPLPDGLSFVESSRTITGTPTTVQDIDVTYKVTDADNDTASVEFKISVSEGDTSPTLQTVNDQYARKDSPFSFTLPRSAGGNAPYTYTATPLPTGLTFNESELKIEGTPTQVEDVRVTYTVTDTDLDFASQSFTIHVSDDLMPSFNDIDDFDARVDSPFSKVLPEAISGDLPITYTATNLPDGLTFAPDSRTISGTPTSTATKTVTYGAEDEDGDKASVEFDIVVNPDSQPSLPAVDDFRARRGHPHEKQLPPATGGDGTLVYSAQGLPPGLDFITTTQIITGTPTRDGNYTVTYAVVDEDNDRNSVQFNIEVAENWHSNNNNNGDSGTEQTTPNVGNTLVQDNQPALGTIPDYNAKVDTLFTQDLIAATGGDGNIGYTAAPLPPGLSFIEGSRTITGKPTTEGTTSVVYTATDADGDKVQRTFDIVVYLKPSLADVSDVMATKDAVFTLDLPDVEGGRGPFDFTASPRPAGLNFIESSRIITGTPTTVEEVDVTYTVTDADGDSASVEFKISVTEGDTSPTLQTINAQYARKDSPFSFTLPRPAGGNAPYTYAAAPLPTGLTFNESELKIEGTPTQVEDVSVTYTVTDTDLDVASRSFTIHVSEDLKPSFNDIDDFEAGVNSPFSEVLPEAISGDLPITYTATNLPDGLTFAPGSRTISGTPTSSVTKTITYGAEDEDGDKASTTFKIVVAEDLQSNQPKNNNNNNKNNNNNGGKSISGRSNSGSNNGGSNNGGSNNGGSNNGGTNNGGTSNGGNGGTNTNYDPGSNNGGTGNGYVSTNPCLSPISGAPPTVPVATTTPYLLNVRQGPGLHYAVVTTVPRGTQANIYGRDTADDWFLVEIQGIAGRVWIYQDLTTVQGSLNTVPFVSPTDTDPVGSPVDAPLAITKPSILNVRSGPGLNYQVLTSVPSGTQGRIIGVSPDYQWYRVVLGVLSQPAWVYASLTTVTGSLATVKVYTLAEIDGGLSVICDKPFALTTPYVLNVRGGPGIEYDILTTVPRGTRAEIVGIGPQNQWLYVELDALTEPAWIFKDLTTVFGSLAGVRQIASWQVGQPAQPGAPEEPGTANEGDRPLAITYSSIVNVREGPGESYNVLIAVGQGTRARILGIDPTEAWYLVEIDGLDQLGWIFEDLTVLVGSLSNVKRITAEEISMLPVAIPKLAVLNVRSGPSTSYGVVTTISAGMWYQILGISASSNWFRIKMDGIAGQTWVFRDLTRLVGPLASATRIVEGDSSPPATAASPPQNEQQATPQQPSSQQQASPPTSPPAPAVSSITIELSLLDDGRIDLDVTWTDTSACAQVYNLYYRANVDSSVYFSLETAVTSSTASSKSLSFETLPASSFISAWCGTSSGGRQVAEVQIDPTQAGTYSSQPEQPQPDALALEQ